MNRRVIVFAVMASCAVMSVDRFAAQEPPAPRMPAPQSGAPGMGASDSDLSLRMQRAEQRTARLEAAMKESTETSAKLSKELRALSDEHEKLTRAIAVEGNVVRINGNLRLENNVLEDQTIVDCDADSTGGTKRRCTCPDGRIAVGIELRPIAVSAMPGPSSYNTALVCSRM